MTTIALFASALAASAVLVGFIRRWAVRKAILDHPNERSSHAVPTPRGGGIAIVVITLAGGALWMTPRIAAAAVAALVIAAVSFAERPPPPPRHPSPRRPGRRCSIGGGLSHAAVASVYTVLAASGAAAAIAYIAD